MILQGKMTWIALLPRSRAAGYIITNSYFRLVLPMENLERILGFFYLPLLQQSLLLAAALVVLLGIRKTDTVRISRLAIPLIIFLFVRDILAAFWGHPLIALSSDAAPAIFVAVIFLLEKKNKLHILILAVFSILFSGVLALAIGADRKSVV